MASVSLLKSGAVLIIITCGSGNTESRSRLQSCRSYNSITRSAGKVQTQSARPHPQSF